MKKHFLWLAVGATALAACTSTDVLEEGPQSNAIGFENVVNKATRATTDLTTDDLSKFVVFGYYANAVENVGDEPTTIVKVFDNETVTKTDNIWGYTNTRYWNPGYQYYFYAYSCGNDVLGSTDGTASLNFKGAGLKGRALNITGFTCDADHQNDLVCDAVEGMWGATSGNSNVKFQFQHALCKVSAEFVNDFPDVYDIYVSDVKLVNFYDQADALIYDNAIDWSNQGRNLASTPSIGMDVKGDGLATSTLKYGDSASSVTVDPVFMLPVSYANTNVYFEFTVTVKDSETQTEVLTRTIRGSFKPNWAFGNQYKYIIHISGSTAQLEEIKFDAETEVSAIQTPENSIKDIDAEMTFNY